MKIGDESTVREYYAALVRRDESYRGVFVVGVSSTGIFCLPTCPARKPKAENCEFYPDARDALRHGYRPCKRCRPTGDPSLVPEAVGLALAMLEDPLREGRVSDTDLKNAGISPEYLRRWYQKRYGITFQAYQRMLRINRAFAELQSRDTSVSGAAMNAGYDSLSGFGYTYRKLIQSAPSKAPESSLILMDRLDTPIGPMFAAASDRGLCLLEFTDRRMLESELEVLQRRLKSRIIFGANAHINAARSQLAEYFRGERAHFDLSLHAPGSDFQQAVWKALRDIPFGTTESYGELARRMGRQTAVRAVGAANGANRIAIVIPCHRVIGADGSLTGYGGGLDRKRWLLDHEKRYHQNSNG
jgi:AraC family transcriptional regulator of adaptative response/methylated-DNA-[protein]-cysteine methyltransferase